MKSLYSFITVIFTVSIIFLAALISPKTVQAETAAPSAMLVAPDELLQKMDDNRVQILRGFLESRNSPLAPYAKTFIDEADKNNLDWRLIAAISGLESSFGIHIPAYSYNGWGFGIYGDNVKRFDSWEEGIITVSAAIRNEYMNKRGATTVPEIGEIYAASTTWAIRVQYFINAIDEFDKNQEKPQLALSL